MNRYGDREGFAQDEIDGGHLAGGNVGGNLHLAFRRRQEKRRRLMTPNPQYFQPPCSLFVFYKLVSSEPIFDWDYWRGRDESFKCKYSPSV